MSGDRKRRKKMKEDPKVDAPPDDKFFSIHQYLLPGIPNAITLAGIATKIVKPLETFFMLSSRSTAWREALQYGLVQAERIRLQSAETFIVLQRYDRELGLDVINLFSMREKILYRLPPIPQVPLGIPPKCKCVGLNGRFYIMGGSGSPGVYMWDLAGQRQWTQCPQMIQGRQEFGCGVHNGKIYVFGGSTGNKTVVRGSEVYDPTSNTWSPIRPFRVNNQFDHNVTKVGEVLYVYGGKYHDFGTWGGVRYDRGVKDVHGWKVFHPVQNKWTFPSSNNFRREFEGAGKLFVVAQEKILSISLSLIKVYDRSSKLWTELHSFSFGAIESKHSVRHSTGRQYYIVREIRRIEVVGNELLALVSGSFFYRGFSLPIRNKGHDLLIHSKGFDSGDTELSWEDISGPLTGFSYNIMCPVQF